MNGSPPVVGTSVGVGGTEVSVGVGGGEVGVFEGVWVTVGG